MQMKSDIQLQYSGFLNTPNLWTNDSISGLKQLAYDSKTFILDDHSRFNERRLGKRVEQFVAFQFENLDSLKIIANNIQVKDGKQTIGELDLLLLDNEQTIHLEIVYKFYLYDATITSENPLDKWIGPNKKDVLIYKLNKLKEKQLPLIHHPSCRTNLEAYAITPKDIQQRVCFKAQLFLPYKANSIDISPLNSSCIIGYYLSYANLIELTIFEFYIPKKLDWLIQPHAAVCWLDYDNAKKVIELFVNEQRSPLCWLKGENNQLKKCFITFW
jgi:hypothetical protein